MNRWLLIGSLAGMMFAFSGCCSTGSNGGCSSGGGVGIFGSSAACGPGCSNGKCGGGGILGGGALARAGGALGGCNGGCNGSCGGACGLRGVGSRAAGLVGLNGGGACNGRVGCRAGALGWQSGGLDYSSHLQPGLLGHNAAQSLNARPVNPGPPTGQVAYPYYTVRGPRDFLVDNPPTIGR